jgi:hypothetical protein
MDEKLSIKESRNWFILIIHADTLKKVYYHLFNNAFQPGSEMQDYIASKILMNGK